MREGVRCDVVGNLGMWVGTAVREEEVLLSFLLC